jgi:hypothetical protein
MRSVPESSAEKNKLKRLVGSLILAQGNVFIKELLRNKQKTNPKITIGGNKAEFEKNLAAAIDADWITSRDVEDWLALTEGWGGQHVYLYQALPKQPHQDLIAKATASRFKGLLNPVQNVSFPNELSLTAIVIDNEKLLLTWHRGSAWFSRAKDKDRELQDGLDRYELRAYLEHQDRAVVRFEWQFAKGFCGLFVQLAIADPAHAAVKEQVWEVLVAIGAVDGPRNPVQLVGSVRKLGSVQGSVERGTKWTVAGGYVDIYADADGGVAAVGPVARTRQGLDVDDFTLADGQFELPTRNPLPGEAKVLKFAVHGGEGRVRINSQCLKTQVYDLIGEVWRQNV